MTEFKWRFYQYRVICSQQNCIWKYILENGSHLCRCLCVGIALKILQHDSHRSSVFWQNSCPFPSAPVACVHYNDVIMSSMASQIPSLTIVYSTVYSCADQRKHQSFASLAFVWGIHRWPVNSPHKGPVTWKKNAEKITSCGNPGDDGRNTCSL